jgi:hypothetical protein
MDQQLLRPRSHKQQQRSSSSGGWQPGSLAFIAQESQAVSCTQSSAFVGYCLCHRIIWCCEQDAGNWCLVAAILRGTLFVL